MNSKKFPVQPSPRPLTRSVFSLINSFLQIVVCPIIEFIMDQNIKYILDDQASSSPSNNSTKSFNSPDSVILPSSGTNATKLSTHRRLTQIENELSKVLGIVDDMVKEREKYKAQVEDLSKQLEDLKEQNVTIKNQLDRLGNQANGDQAENEDVDALSVSALCARIRERCEQFDEQISNGPSAVSLTNRSKSNNNHVHFQAPTSSSTETADNHTPQESKFNFGQFTPYVVIDSEISDNSCSTATIPTGEEATEILTIERSLDSKSFTKNKTSTPSFGERLKTYAKKIVTRSNSSASANSSAFESKYTYVGDVLESSLSRRSSIEMNSSENNGHNSTFTK